MTRTEENTPGDLLPVETRADREVSGVGLAVAIVRVDGYGYDLYREKNGWYVVRRIPEGSHGSGADQIQASRLFADLAALAHPKKVDPYD